MKCVFILGKNPELSAAEIMAVLPSAIIVAKTDLFLILENKEFDCQKILRQLGGTIKIGRVIGTEISTQIIADNLLTEKKDGKINFGISSYTGRITHNTKQQILKFGLEVKKILKDKGVSSRLVTSREDVLSSVVVAKNKCQEFLILDDEWLAKTCAVQEFEEYSVRDYGRPASDPKSGMLPPKLAKMMINLAQAPTTATILDPFCGSGTILQEAIVLGYQNVIGSDISQKAIDDTKKNLEWLKHNYQFSIINYQSFFNYQLFKIDVKDVSKNIEPVDVIVTEPYLGPALSGRENKNQLDKIINELLALYLAAFGEFKKILKPGGRIVIIFPVFKINNQTIKLPISDKIFAIGFKRINSESLYYQRPGQRVSREIIVLENQ